MNRLPPFVWSLIDRLRRRGLGIGIDDCDALRAALAAGFGLRSDEALRNVCIALWAKTTGEAALISTAFAGPGLPRWSAEADDDDVPEPSEPTESASSVVAADEDVAPNRSAAEPRLNAVRTEELGARVSPPPDFGGTDASLFIVPQFPLSAREIAQIWRRLNRSSRSGPPVEVDGAATLDRLARSGVATPPVVLPRRTNRIKLLLLLDRNGSMSPYHSYVEHVVLAIETLGRLDSVTVRYFHDVPGTSSDRGVLSERADQLTPQLDSVLAAIRPLPALRVYRDPRLAWPDQLDHTDLAQHTSAVVVSDAGAARGRYDGARLVDTIAFGRALRQVPRCTVAWLNPVGLDRTIGTTAEQVGRHIPMFPMNRTGMTLAVDVLRGRPPVLERPL